MQFIRNVLLSYMYEKHCLFELQANLSHNPIHVVLLLKGIVEDYNPDRHAMMAHIVQVATHTGCD